MADDDDIEALLREIDQMNAAEGKAPDKAVVPAKAGKEAAKAEEGRSPRVTWTLIATVGCGGVGFVVGLLLAFLPLISPLSTAVGAALGGAIAALVGGPPKWLRD
jgi:hypothetical protein